MRTSRLTHGAGLIAAAVAFGGCGDSSETAPGDARGPDASCAALDLAADPDNCGQCGRSCGGGACQMGRCEPVVLTSDAHSPCRIAVDPSGVYWANSTVDGTVVTMPHGGGAPTVLATAQERAFAVALDETSVYWTTYTLAGAIARVPKAGGTTTVLASAQRRPRALVAAREAIWWVNFDASELVRAPATGGAAERQVAVAGPYDLASDGTSVYWTSGGSRSLFRRDLGGGEVVELATWGCDKVTGCVASIAVGGGNVFVALEDASEVNGTVFAVPTAGGEARQVADGQRNPASIAVDDANVYWVSLGTAAGNYLDGEVWMAPLAGGEAVALATTQPRPCGVAASDGSVYWTRAGDDRVLRQVVR